MRAAPPTNRPISGRRRNLRFPGTFLGISGNRDSGISSGIPAARFPTSPSRVLEGVSGENGARKSTGRAGRRGPAFESRPAHKSPDFGPIRKSSVSGEIVGEIRKSGFRDLVRTPYRGVYWIPAARVLTSPPRVLEGAPGENGARNFARLRRPAGAAFSPAFRRISGIFGIPENGPRNESPPRGFRAPGVRFGG